MINWEDEFIPISVKNNIGLSSSNYFKHKDYTYDLSQNNIKNHIHVAILDCNKSQSSLVSRYIFSNIDRIYNYPVLKLTFTVYNFSNNNTDKSKSLIIYSNNTYPQYLND